MRKSEINGVLGAVMIAGIVVAVLSYANPVVGYILIATTVLLAAIVAWRSSRGEADGGVWLPLLLTGVVIAFASCRISVKRSGEEHQRQRAQEVAVEKRRAQAEAEAKRVEAQAQLRKRSELLQAELGRPLSERAIEAEASLDKALGRDAVARAICYADTLLAGAEPSSEIKSLKKVRDRAAKEVTSAYQAELSTDRGLLCRDGTVSPSCTCGGSRRGCCSHHGGVAGCEPKPKVEFDCGEQRAHRWLEHHLVAVGRALPGGYGPFPSRKAFPPRPGVTPETRTAGGW